MTLNQYSETTWTEEREKNLRQLQSEGWSYTEIARALGGGLSRNACIGKAKRLGLLVRESDHKFHHKFYPRPRAEKPKEDVMSAKPKRRERLRPVLSGWPTATEETDDPAPVAVVSILSPDAIPLKQRRTFKQLKDHHCRFPYGDVGDAGFFFCGAIKHETSYCAFHERVAFK